MFQPLLSLLCFTFLLAGCAGGSAEARTDYDNAMKYLQGIGVEQNEAKGMALLQKAADARNPDAELMLGFFLMKGEGGIPKNEEAAMKLFLDAARQGNRDAQYNAGLAYVRAQGVEENHTEALKWFTAAALQGDPGAQYNTGVMHRSGEGTVASALTAYAWFAIAAKNGYDGAKEAMETAKQGMTSDEAGQADAAIEQLQKKIVLPKMTDGIRLNSRQEAPL